MPISDEQLAPTAPVTSTASPARRIAAAIGGIAGAVAFGFATAGIAVVATIATLIAWAVTRKRTPPLTRGVSWLIGVGAVATALVVGLGFVVAGLPAGSLTSFQVAMDSSASKPPPPPPEWLRRITPPAAQAQSRATDRLVRTRAFGMWITVMSVVLGVAVIAGITGTLGWSAGVLLLYSVTGRWPPSAPPVGPPIGIR